MIFFPNRLLKISALLVLLVPVLTLSGCASGPSVRSNHDPAADFTSYRTFAFFDELGTDRGGYSTLVSGYFMDAARQEMEARGYIFSETDPDLRINFFTNVREQSDVRSAPGMDLGYTYYGYRRGRYVAFPMYSYRMRPDTVTVHYRIGTANIDVVDSATNRLIWEGVAEGRLGNNVAEQSEALIRTAVADIFRRFPLSAER